MNRRRFFAALAALPLIGRIPPVRRWAGLTIVSIDRERGVITLGASPGDTSHITLGDARFFQVGDELVFASDERGLR